MMGNTLRRRCGGRRRGHQLRKGVYTHPTQVPGTISRIRGKVRLKGSGPITGLKKGSMTNQAVKLGYITKEQSISDIPKSKMDDFAIDLAKAVGSTRATRMFNAQIVFRKNQPNGFKSKMLVAKNTILRKSRVLKVQTKGTK